MGASQANAANVLGIHPEFWSFAGKSVVLVDDLSTKRVPSGYVKIAMENPL